MKKRALAMLLCLMTAVSALLSGCSAQAGDLMSGVEENPVSADAALDGANAGLVTDFGVRLFQESFGGGENTLISPLSVLCALAMTANGARGETLAQMEAALGLPVEELNQYLHAYTNALPSAKKTKLDMANAIWFKDAESFTVEQDFLQANADWYGAGLYKAPFDAGTCKDINDWVKKRTGGMINGILDEISPSAVMYLVNALAFDAEWEEVYKKSQLQDGVFTREDGVRQDAELMYSTEYRYLEDDHAAGFLKYYAGERYAFAALLPEEGLSVADYAAGLTGEHLHGLLSGARTEEVWAAIPAFESDCRVELNDALQAMGMTDAFDPAADFSGIGSSTDGNIFIGQALHRTYISVDAKGTRAAAATLVGMDTGAAAPAEPKTVYLNRPFLYMLIDCQAHVPIFLGAVTDVGT
ncbi:MAG: serpin family protein [Oscillospiraceae bacterium]|nr:serpin family protein [Oscillospiraceae bacterium]